MLFFNQLCNTTMSYVNVGLSICLQSLIHAISWCNTLGPSARGLRGFKGTIGDGLRKDDKWRRCSRGTVGIVLNVGISFYSSSLVPGIPLVEKGSSQRPTRR